MDRQCIACLAIHHRLHGRSEQVLDGVGVIPSRTFATPDYHYI
jgi:hypothetical protein